MIQAVDVLPHLAGDAVADGARILASFGDALNDGAGVIVTKCQKLEDVLGVHFGIEAAEEVFFSRHDHERLPAQVIALLGLLEQHVIVHIENARRIFGAFDIARQPKKRIRDARQHQPSPRKTQVSLLPPPCDEFTTSESRCRATRVSPPGTMVTFSPS